MSQLRGSAAQGGVAKKPSPQLPRETDSAFCVDLARPMGIRFYPARGAFFLPYGALQSVEWAQEILMLNYSTDTITIQGGGLHDLFIAIAEQRVSRIHVSLGVATGSNATEVTQITRLPREPAG
ncbi:MAG: hypothetical protein JNN07_27020 [Verrucomicrobiales bacterium]|nr:hypothetical protein [Verrucomicrobiales bacterium]